MKGKNKAIYDNVDTETSIGFDLDGTVLSSGDWNGNFKELINQLANRYFVFFATGRSMHECKELVHGLDKTIPFICDDGQYVYFFNQQEYMHNEYIDISEENFDFFDANQIEIAVETPKYVYTKSKVLKRLLKIYCGLDEKIVLSGVPREQKQVYKIYYYEKNEGSINEIETKYLITRIGRKFGSMTNRDCNKYTAYMKLIQKMQKGVENTLYFGDGKNDIEMMCAVKNSVAVCNAIPELKVISKYILESENELTEIIMDLIEI